MENFKKAPRLVLGERCAHLLPDAFRDQCIDFAVADHLAHQGQRFFGHGEAQRGVTGCKASDAENTHGIFGKCVRDMAKLSLLEVLCTAPRVDQRAVTVLRHCIDREISSR